MKEKLKNTIDKFKNKNILVMGDVMLDKYVMGTVNRVSPEAPVPIVKTNKEKLTPGGAANVAENAKALCNNCYLIGIIGDDQSGEKLKQKLKNNNIKSFLINSKRPTTVKSRIIAHEQQVVRVDKEIDKPITKELEQEIIKKAKQIINKIDVIILPDYGKGLLTPVLCKNIIDTANKENKITVVDTKDSFSKFKNSTVLKCNIHELEEINKINIRNEKQLEKELKKIKNNINPKYIAVTRGSDGITYLSKKFETIPAVKEEVADVTGAGDTVITIVALSLAGNKTFKDSILLANYGAAVVVDKLGTATVSKEELLGMIK